MQLKCIEEIKEIFFLSTSVKNFNSEEHKKTFFDKWCGDYITHYSNTFFLYLDEDQSLLGYLSGCNDSLLSHQLLKVPAQTVFDDQLLNFPAHLHINFHPRSRGMGLGSILIEHYCQELKGLNINGIHLVTSPDARNVSFYHRLGFDYNLVREYNGSPLFFMGRKLT